MKKLLFFTLSLALVLLALASCSLTKKCQHAYSGPCDTTCNNCENGTRTPEAEHTFTDCTDTSCDVCGATREALAHKYDSTCDSECNTCGATRQADEHIYSSDCDATCNACGAERAAAHIYTNTCDKTCNVCGELRIPEAHQYSNACDTTCDVCGELRMASNHVYASKCDADCNICGEFRIAEPHTYDHSCDGDCNVCGATRTVNDHQYDDACDAICNNCGTVREDVHDFSAWLSKTAADCENAGVEIRYCAICGAEETREVGEALGHVFDHACDIACNRAKCDYTRETTHSYITEFETKLAATCTTPEILHRFCDICGTEETATGEAALGHAFENDCDADCNREDCDFVRVVDEHDHQYSEWATKTPATCLEAEVEYRICSACGGEETRAGDDPLDHDYDNACDTNCNREGCDFEREITHSWGEWVTKTPATCLEAEVEEQLCAICSAPNPQTREGEAALGHIYTDVCDKICDRENCGFERIPPHEYADEHDVTCEHCDYVRTCNGHKALTTDCTVCEYCGMAIPGSEHTYANLCDTTCDVCGSIRAVGPHKSSQEDCTKCLYCGETIEGVVHVPYAKDCTKCEKCDAGTGMAHTPSEHDCLTCGICGKPSGAEHEQSSEDCTKCGICGGSLGTAHTDTNRDGKCDNCEQEALPGQNWFPWAPL